MDMAVFNPDELSTALGAMRALAPKPNAVQDQFMRILGTMHGVAVDPAALRLPTPAETAAVITDPRHRERLLQLAVVNTLLASACTPTPRRAVAELAAALGIDGNALQTRFGARLSLVGSSTA
jgi:hypothetical protein